MAEGTGDSMNWTLQERLELREDLTEIKGSLKRIEKDFKEHREQCDNRHKQCKQTYTTIQRMKAVVAAGIAATGIVGLVLGVLKYIKEM